ncbi:hypothetical protein QTP88_004634 [Uroleucon formosanum]
MNSYYNAFASDVASPMTDSSSLTYLKSAMPEEATDLDGQSETCIKLQKTYPYFLPFVWNIRIATLNNGDRSNNMRHENAADKIEVAEHQLSTIEPPSKNKIKYILKHLCKEHNDGSRDNPNFLNSIANLIRK